MYVKQPDTSLQKWPGQSFYLLPSLSSLSASPAGEGDSKHEIPSERARPLTRGVGERTGGGGWGGGDWRRVESLSSVVVA